jgi:hypothetical protein
MRKLKLDVHALRVESFEASAEAGPRIGTVHGNAPETRVCPVEPVTYDDECSKEESCAVTVCATCLCPHTGPQPSCDPCSWMGDCTFDPAACP